MPAIVASSDTAIVNTGRRMLSSGSVIGARPRPLGSPSSTVHGGPMAQLRQARR